MTNPILEYAEARSAPPKRWLGDRQFWLVLALAAAVLLPRSYLITRSQSERADDEYHIARGLFFLEDPRQLKSIRINDPPLGQAIAILPLYLAGNWKPNTFRAPSFIYGHRFRGDTVLNIIGLWKSLLFVPAVGLIFVWIRRIYGAKSAWLAVILVLVEPTLAGHIPLPTPDVLGMEAFFLAAYLSWHYFERPTLWRQIASCASMAAAMLIKHTAIVLPGVAIAFAFWWWVVRPWWRSELAPSWRGQFWKRVGITISGAVMLWASIFVLLKFDYTAPVLPDHGGKKFADVYPTVGMLLDRHMPGGLYITSLLYGQEVAERGRWGFLNGQIRREGWLQYFPVVATYKIPIGIGVILVAGLVSLIWLKPRWDEWSLFIPMMLVGGFMIVSRFNLGWRHFLPAYVLGILLATRVMVDLTRQWALAAWAMVAFAWGDALRYHPDYIPYITLGRHDAFLAISDSNVDWGEGVPYVKRWLARNPKRKGIYVRSYLWLPTNAGLAQRLGSRVTLLDRPPRLPTSGVIIISPVSLAGLYESRDPTRDRFADPYKPLRERQPDEILGHVMYVYDLDKMKAEGRPIEWGPQPRIRRRPPPRAARRPATRPTTLATTRPATAPAR